MREEMQKQTPKTFEPQDNQNQVSWRFEEQKLEEEEGVNDSNCDMSDVNYQSSHIDIPKPNEAHTTAKKYFVESPEADDGQPTLENQESPDVLIKKKNREQT